VEALVRLGLSANEAQSLVREVLDASPEANDEEVLRAALRRHAEREVKR
jgi:Holliday junction resolvasome RuvABC DNA-binding subunit